MSLVIVRVPGYPRRISDRKGNLLLIHRGLDRAIAKSIERGYAGHLKPTVVKAKRRAPELAAAA